MNLATPHNLQGRGWELGLEWVVDNCVFTRSGAPLGPPRNFFLYPERVVGLRKGSRLRKVVFFKRKKIQDTQPSVHSPLARQDLPLAAACVGWWFFQRQ